MPFSRIGASFDSYKISSIFEYVTRHPARKDGESRRARESAPWSWNKSGRINRVGYRATFRQSRNDVAHGNENVLIVARLNVPPSTWFLSPLKMKRRNRCLENLPAPRHGCCAADRRTKRFTGATRFCIQSSYSTLYLTNRIDWQRLFRERSSTVVFCRRCVIDVCESPTSYLSPATDSREQNPLLSISIWVIDYPERHHQEILTPIFELLSGSR